MRDVTKYRFTLPDGQTHAGESPEHIFATHPDAVITHHWHRDAAGVINEERITPPLRFAPPVVDSEPEPFVATPPVIDQGVDDEDTEVVADDDAIVAGIWGR